MSLVFPSNVLSIILLALTHRRDTHIGWIMEWKWIRPLIHYWKTCHERPAQSQWQHKDNEAEMKKPSVTSREPQGWPERFSQLRVTRCPISQISGHALELLRRTDNAGSLPRRSLQSNNDNDNGGGSNMLITSWCFSSAFSQHYHAWHVLMLVTTLRLSLFLSPFHQCGNRGSEKMRNFP